jgi:hypothetical protein
VLARYYWLASQFGTDSNCSGGNHRATANPVSGHASGDNVCQRPDAASALLGVSKRPLADFTVPIRSGADQPLCLRSVSSSRARTLPQEAINDRGDGASESATSDWRLGAWRSAHKTKIGETMLVDCCGDSRERKLRQQIERAESEARLRAASEITARLAADVRAEPVEAWLQRRVKDARAGRVIASKLDADSGAQARFDQDQETAAKQALIELEHRHKRRR